MSDTRPWGPWMGCIGRYYTEVLDDCIDFAYSSMSYIGVGKPVFTWFVQPWAKKRPDAALLLKRQSATGSQNGIP